MSKNTSSREKKKRQRKAQHSQIRTSASAVQAAKSYLLSVEPLLNEGCIGHLPEILDGNAPHMQRGCDAQAWSMSEFLRLINLLR